MAIAALDAARRSGWYTAGWVRAAIPITCRPITRQHLAASAIRLVEPREHRAVEIEHAEQIVPPISSGTTSSERDAVSQAIWPGKASTSGTSDGAALRRRRAAHALAEGDAHTGRAALEGSQHQFAARAGSRIRPSSARASAW